MPRTYRRVSGVSMWDDDAGYDRTDPKHPDFAEALLTWVDNARKADKENDTVERASEEDAA